MCAVILEPQFSGKEVGSSVPRAPPLKEARDSRRAIAHDQHDDGIRIVGTQVWDSKDVLGSLVERTVLEGDKNGVEVSLLSRCRVLSRQNVRSPVVSARVVIPLPVYMPLSCTRPEGLVPT